jgi:L-ascorbate metabolism protein UlaG (beta-lactamase superfamily)
LSDYVAEQLGPWWARAYPPPVPADQVTNARYYFISHEHWDHLDPTTVRQVATASPQAHFLTNGWCREILLELGIPPNRVTALTALERTRLDDTDLHVTAVPSAHYAKEFDPHKGYRWLGFLLEWNGVCLYHAGDTIIYPDYVETLRRLPPIDLAILPVNGRDYYREAANVTGNLLPAEAAQLAHAMGWDLVIPGHNDLYANNVIPDSEIVAALMHYAPRQKYKLMKPAECFYYIKSEAK